MATRLTASEIRAVPCYCGAESGEGCRVMFSSPPRHKAVGFHSARRIAALKLKKVTKS